MIRTILVQNLQSHKKTLIELCQGFNIIIGEGCSGKSAFMRGFELLRKSRPLGLEKRSLFAGTKPMKVQVNFFDDTPTITFIHGPKIPRMYRIGYEQCSAIGSDVPDVVTKALCVPDIAIQTQGAKHFFLFAGPTEIAKEVNSVSGLEVVDPAIASLNRKIKDAEYNIGHIEDEIDKLVNELTQLKNVDSLKAKVLELESLLEKQKLVKVKMTQLKSYIVDLYRINNQLRKYSKSEKTCTKIVSELESLLGKTTNIVAKHKHIDEFLCAYKTTKETIATTTSNLQSIKKSITHVFGNKKRCPLCFNKVSDVSKVIERL